MGESLLFSLNSTMPLFFIMVLGCLLHRKNFLTDDFVAMANKFVFNVALPVQLFRDLATMDVRASFDGAYVLFCAAATTASILVIWVLAKLLLKDKHIVGEFVQACYRSSAAILGAAFIQNIYGTSGMSGLMILGSVPLYNIFAVVILTLESPINIKDMRFLKFQVYVDTTDGSEGDLSLNNLYLELLDNQTPTPGQKGSLGTTGINGATYGSVEVTTDQWVTVKLDLHKMKEQGDFNNNVTTIRVGDNYNRNIYFRNFTFIPKAVPSKVTGFTTDQEKIPDYGSAESGHLENAENAQYTSSNDTDTQLVDKDGRFVLEAGETVTFSDQFRRGSYISLKEELNQNLYDTKWTVCENGKEVESMSGGKSVSLLDPAPPLIEQKGSGPDDGRTEKITSETEQESGNVQNIYNGQKPTTANTIVFRSYKDPDETKSTLTKLKVKYVNTVKTGGLKIQKKAAEGETLTGTYTFKVTFNDVGGAGLEKEDIIRYVEIDMTDEKKYPDHTVTITGIPVGTRYTIEEETPLDGSRLQLFRKVAM